MQMEILHTNLQPPVRKNDHIRRETLINRVFNNLIVAGESNFSQPFTLITGPAGYGKTSFLLDCYEEVVESACWLTVSQDNNIPNYFFIYLVTALRRHDDFELDTSDLMKKISGAALDTTHGQEDIKNFALKLLNILQDCEFPLYIFLDDIHQLEKPGQFNYFQYIIDNLPSQTHIMAASRSLAPFPTIRWRGEGKMKIVTKNDLQFSAEEVKEFFAEANLSIDYSTAFELREKVEGWPTGIRLMGAVARDKSPRHTEEIDVPRQNFQLFDYLVQEVINNLREELQQFLLRTSCLGRFNYSLADMVTAGKDSAKLLREISEQQLFLQIIEGEEKWFRYHSVFAEALRQRLDLQDPDGKKEVHRKAAKWYEEKGMIEEAINQIISAGDLESLADMLFKHSLSMIFSGKHSFIISSIDELPEEVLEENPDLKSFKIFAKLMMGNIQAVRSSLSEIQEQFDRGDFAELSKKKEKICRGLNNVCRLFIDNFRHSFQPGSREPEKSLADIKKSIENLPEGSPWQFLGRYILADRVAIRGNLERALNILEGFRNEAHSQENNYYLVIAGVKEALYYWFQGRLNSADSLSGELLRNNGKSIKDSSNRACLLLAIRAAVAAEKDELERGDVFLEQGLKILSGNPEPGLKALFYVLWLRHLFAREDYPRGEEILRELEGLQEKVQVGSVQFLKRAWRVRFWLEEESSTGNIWRKALKYLQEHGVEQGKKPRVFRHYEYLALSRALIQGKKYKEAEKLLGKIIELAEQRRLIGAELKAKLLISRVLFHQTGDKYEGFTGKETAVYHDFMDDALFLAQKHGYLRSFIEEGGQIKPLLEGYLTAKKGNIDPDQNVFIGGLLSSLPDYSKETAKQYSEVLSDREKEILQEISRGLTNIEIADNLHISLNTVKWHTSNIYSKLDVKNRTEAVKKGRTLGII